MAPWCVMHRDWLDRSGGHQEPPAAVSFQSALRTRFPVKRLKSRRELQTLEFYGIGLPPSFLAIRFLDSPCYRVNMCFLEHLSTFVVVIWRNHIDVAFTYEGGITNTTCLVICG